MAKDIYKSKIDEIFKKHPGPDRCKSTAICKCLSMALNMSDSNRGIVLKTMITMKTGKTGDTGACARNAGSVVMEPISAGVRVSAMITALSASKQA